MNKVKFLYFTIILSCLVLISGIIYYSLGGFDSLEIFEAGATERTVVGKEYMGKYRPATFEEHLNEVLADRDSGKLAGKLTVVFFKNETLGQDSVHYFVGTSTDEIKNVVQLPPGYDFREFQSQKIFKLYMTMHWLVQPTPEEVDALMQQKAQEENLELLPIWFQVYFEDKSLAVEYWTK